jgi:guanine nucleotide-binding protein subunit alpha
MYARDAFARDRENWKGVILLNLIRCMSRVVDSVIQAAESADDEDSADDFSPDAPPPISSLVTDSHRRICLRLQTSLGLAERELKARISPHSTGANYPLSGPATAEELVDREAEAEEVSVPAHSYALGPRLTESHTVKSSRRLSVLPQTEPVDSSDPNDPANLTLMCRQDMIDLWSDPVIKTILARRKVRWQDWPGL